MCWNGTSAWPRESGTWRSASPAPTDTDQLQQRITMPEQNLADIQGQLDERGDELEAARAANRELTRALNQRE